MLNTLHVLKNSIRIPITLNKLTFFVIIRDGPLVSSSVLLRLRANHHLVHKFQELIIIGLDIKFQKPIDLLFCHSFVECAPGQTQQKNRPVCAAWLLLGLPIASVSIFNMCLDAIVTIRRKMIVQTGDYGVDPLIKVVGTPDIWKR